MKYRDLIFMLMVVAVGMMWWSGARSATMEDEPQHTETVAKAEPIEAETPAPMPPKIKVTPQPKLPPACYHPLSLAAF